MCLWCLLQIWVLVFYVSFVVFAINALRCILPIKTTSKRKRFFDRLCLSRHSDTRLIVRSSRSLCSPSCCCARAPPCRRVQSLRGAADVADVHRLLVDIPIAGVWGLLLRDSLLPQLQLVRVRWLCGGRSSAVPAKLR